MYILNLRLNIQTLQTGRVQTVGTWIQELTRAGKEVREFERVLVTFFVCTSYRSLQDLLTKDI